MKYFSVFRQNDANKNFKIFKNSRIELRILKFVLVKDKKTTLEPNASIKEFKTGDFFFCPTKSLSLFWQSKKIEKKENVVCHCELTLFLCFLKQFLKAFYPQECFRKSQFASIHFCRGFLHFFGCKAILVFSYKLFNWKKRLSCYFCFVDIFLKQCNVVCFTLGCGL